MESPIKISFFMNKKNYRKYVIKIVCETPYILPVYAVPMGPYWAHLSIARLTGSKEHFTDIYGGM